MTPRRRSPWTSTPCSRRLSSDPVAGHRPSGQTLEPRRRPVRLRPQRPAVAADLQPGHQPAVGRCDHSGRPADLGRSPRTMAPGDYSVPVIAADDGTPRGVRTPPSPWTWLAVEPPSIASIPGQSAKPGQTFYLDLGQYVTDQNSPALPLTYALTGGPPGASISPTTGLFTWVTPANQPRGGRDLHVPGLRQPHVGESDTGELHARRRHARFRAARPLPVAPDGGSRPCRRRARRSRSTSQASRPTPTRRPCRCPTASAPAPRRASPSTRRPAC